MRFISQKNRSILREMVSTDFKVRYQGSALGYLWSLLKPLFIFTILYIVFTKFLKLGGSIPHFPVYLLLGIVIWNFFTESTSSGMGSIVGRGDLIRKISIPRYLVVMSGTFSALINLALNLGVVFIFALFNGLYPQVSWLLLVPIIIELYILSQALAFFLAALYVKYRDASYIWEVLLQAMFYATPIIYPLQIVAEKYQPLLLLNPMAQIIQDARWAVVTDQTLTSWGVIKSPFFIIPPLIVLLISVISFKYFKKQSKYFAENI